MLTYPELRNFVARVRNDESVELLDKAVEVFDKYEVPGYMDVYNATLSEPNTEENSIVSLLLEDTIMACNQLLLIQGITTVEDITLSKLIDLTSATYDMIYYEDKDRLETILNTNESVIEIYGQLISLVSLFTVEDILSLVSEVSDSFVDTFKGLLENLEEQSKTQEELDQLIATYNQYKKVILKGQSNYSEKFTDSPETIGMPYEIYLQLYIKEVPHKLDLVGTVPNEIATDLLGLACLSLDGYTNPLLVIRSRLSELYSDIESTTKIDIAVSKLIQELVRG